MPRFIHAADLHLDSPLLGLEAYEGAPVERMREATRAALQNLVALAIDEQAAFVVLAGDVYDTDPRVETALFFRAQMQRLADAHIPAVIVRGNHDPATIAPKNVQLPAGITVLSSEAAESTEIPGAGAVVHGRSYPRFDYDLDLTDGYPKPLPGLLNVGLLHTALAGVEGHARYAPTTESALRAKGYQYWALGHVHARKSFSSGGSRIEFPGNLQGRHARETGAKGALVVDYEGTAVREVRFAELDVVRWHQVEVDAAGAPADGLRQLVRDRVFAETAEARDSGRLCVVRVALRGSFAGPESELPTSDELREFLQGELQEARGQLWLEKVAVRATPQQAGRSEMMRQLDEISGELLGSPEACDELREVLRTVRKTVHGAYPALLDENAALLPAKPAQQELEAAMERARELLRKALR